MKFRYFLFTNFIARFIGVAGCVFFSDSMLKFGKGNIWIWIVFVLLMMACLIFVIKNKSKIDDFINGHTRKKILKNKNNVIKY